MNDVATILLQDIVILDTETTGISSSDQIIEIAIIDKYKNVLLDTRIKPTVCIGTKALDVHGISEQKVKNCHPFSFYHEQIQQILKDKIVCIFNADFDQRLLIQSAQAHQLNVDFYKNMPTFCAMYAAAKAYGSTNWYGTISLADSIWKAKVTREGNAHSALSDVLATIDVMNHIASLSQ